MVVLAEKVVVVAGSSEAVLGGITACLWELRGNFQLTLGLGTRKQGVGVGLGPSLLVPILAHLGPHVA